MIKWELPPDSIHSHWPYDDEHGYYAIPIDWSAEYIIPTYSNPERERNKDIIQWILDNIKNPKSNAWWLYEYYYLKVAFRKQKDYTMFLLRWS